jgi:hypothetical protein
MLNNLFLDLLDLGLTVTFRIGLFVYKVIIQPKRAPVKCPCASLSSVSTSPSNTK